MANTQAICTSFKSEILIGNHQLGACTLTSRTSLTVPTTDTIKAALYLATATVNAATTAYSVTNEVTGAGYSAGGVTVTNATAPNTSGTTAFWTPSASIVYTTVTVGPTDCVLLYNSSQSNKAIAAYTFSSQTVTAGTLTLTMPTNDASTGLLRIA
jgi:hypothetical protein